MEAPGPSNGLMVNPKSSNEDLRCPAPASNPLNNSKEAGLPPFPRDPMRAFGADEALFRSVGDISSARDGDLGAIVENEVNLK